MAETIKVKNVFSGLDMPDITYVAQDNGKHEKDLTYGIEEGGNLCLITGSSKTGKTTLYKRVLQTLEKEPIVVRCDSTLDTDDFWKKPLETLNFDRLANISESELSESSVAGKVGGKLGWSWLAGLIGEVSLGVKKNSSETESREKIVSQPSASHLVPLLKYSNAILVVEDFHYLTEEIQRQIFQQWKTFTDQQVSILVVGTTHHGVDLAYANPDLVGRIEQIDLGRWESKDLCEIATKGFIQMGINIPAQITNLLARESSGLPIITQQACSQLFFDQGIATVKIGAKIVFTRQQAYSALHNMAVRKYKQFESWYSRLTDGPRKKNRKYNTYEIILLIFALDPLKFELKRHEIDNRILKLGLVESKIPPAASINSTLSALERFQKSIGFELLEWSKRDKKIYVLEPSFLYYLRWRKPRTKAPEFREILDDFRNVTALIVKERLGEKL